MVIRTFTNASVDTFCDIFLTLFLFPDIEIMFVGVIFYEIVLSLSFSLTIAQF